MASPGCTNFQSSSRSHFSGPLHFSSPIQTQELGHVPPDGHPGGGGDVYGGIGLGGGGCLVRFQRFGRDKQRKKARDGPNIPCGGVANAWGSPPKKAATKRAVNKRAGHWNERRDKGLLHPC